MDMTKTKDGITPEAWSKQFGLTPEQEQQLGGLIGLGVGELQAALQSVTDLALLDELHTRCRMRGMYGKAAALHARIVAVRKANASAAARPATPELPGINGGAR